MPATLQSGDGKTILLADDEPEIRDYLQTALRCKGFAVQAVEDGEDALSCIEDGQRPSLILLDVMMPRKNGMDTLRQIRRFDREVPVIMLSCASSPVNVVEAIKSGATDFLPKPISHNDLSDAIAKALAQSVLGAGSLSPEPPSEKRVFFPFVPLGGGVESTLLRLGSSEVPVLIQGETGVGKEVFARRLHAQSPRADKRFVKLNCAALPSELVESELFGYERGAFTGALHRKPGLFEIADGGTILLDEIGDMDYRCQAKLLQVLQDQEFLRLGGRGLVRVDIRVIAATHCDLEEAIAAKRFRADLYYRLNVVSVRIPPMRERQQDILPLTDFLIKKHSKGAPPPCIPLELRQALVEYPWPGNVRELENLIQNFLALRDADEVIRKLRMQSSKRQTLELQSGQPDYAPPVLAKAAVRAHDSVLKKVDEAKQNAEKEAILSALNSKRWNRKQAATLLNIDYKALLYKMKKLGIQDQDES